MHTHLQQSGSSRLFSLVQRHPVEAVIVDMSTGRISITLLCGTQTIRDVEHAHLQKLYELDQLPRNIVEYLKAQSVIAP